MIRRYYEVLAVSEDASPEEIERAYKRAASRTHPDKNRGREEEAAEEFKDVKRAYECLSDPERRTQYDKYGTDESEPLGNPGLDLFVMLFDQTIDRFETMDGFFKNTMGSIDSLFQEIADKRKDLQKQTDKLQRMLKNVEYKGSGTNLIEGLIQNRLKGLEEAELELKKADQAAHAVKEMLKDYQTLDKEPPRRSSQESQLIKDIQSFKERFSRGGFESFT